MNLSIIWSMELVKEEEFRRSAFEIIFKLFKELRKLSCKETRKTVSFGVKNWIMNKEKNM